MVKRRSVKVKSILDNAALVLALCMLIAAIALFFILPAHGVIQ